jgi:RHS repeat-associated protein
MRISRLFSCLATLLFLNVAARTAVAQDDPNFAAGIQPYRSYHGGNIDSVSLFNGSLTVKIPLMSYPQIGGKLQLNLTMIYENRGYFGDNVCVPIPPGNGTSCQIVYTSNGSGFRIVDEDSVSTVATNVPDGSPAGFLRTFNVVMADGSSMGLVDVGTVPMSVFESVVASGYRLEGGIVTDPEGVRMTPGCANTDNTNFFLNVWSSVTAPCSSPLRQDPNGNKITYSTSAGWLDTVGRSISMPVSTTDYSGCTGSRQVNSGLLWSLPGPNGGFYTVKFCYVIVPINIGTGQGSFTENRSMLQSLALPNGTTWTFQYTTDGNGDLSQITLPTGGTLSYTWLRGAVLVGSHTITFNRGVATRTLNANDGNPSSIWTYSYAPNAPSNFTPPQTIVTDALGNDTAHNFGIPGQTAFPYDVETGTQFYQGSHTNGTLLKSVSTKYSYSVWSSGNNPFYFDTVPSIVTTTWANGQTKQTQYDYDPGVTAHFSSYFFDSNNNPRWNSSATAVVTYGRIVATRDYDYGVGRPGPLLRATNYSYKWQSNGNYLSAANLLNTPCLVTTYSGSASQQTSCTPPSTVPANQVAQTIYGYDENNGGPQGPFGNQTSVSQWLNVTGAYLTNKKVYNSQGMVTQSTDPLLNSTNFTYDSTGAFLSQIQFPTTSGVSHSEHFAIDPNTGLATSHTDQNGQITATRYDTLSRAIQVNFPDGGQTTTCYTDTGGPTCAQRAPPYALITTRKMSTTQNETTTELVDGLGRLTQTQLNSDPDCPSGDKTDTTYDGLGRVYTVSNPYCTTSDSTYGLTTYTYDALGRTTQVAHPDGATILTNYTGRATQVQDEGNGTQPVTRISQTDGLGRLSSLCEVAPGPFIGANGASTSSLIGSSGAPVACGQDIAGTGFLTTYQYDASNNLLQVNQSGIGSRTFTYDSLSRLLTASNPESGAISYTYDANGNLLTKTAPAPNQTGTTTVTTTYQYDALNRLTKKSYSDGATPATTFAYDSGCDPTYYHNQIGRLDVSSVPGWASCIGYDSMGRLADKDMYDPKSNLYYLDYTYDLLGDITSQTAGYGSATYTYNTAGRPITVTSSYSDPNNPATVFSAAHYNAFGGLTSDTLGNGETETYSYVPKLTRLQSYTAKLNTATIYNFNIGTFASNGDILAANDSANGNWTYAYDPFNRLVGANKNIGQVVYNYVYDRFGNRWQQNGPQTFIATFTGNNPGTPQNNNRMDGYSYDAAGNLLNDGTHSYTYDAENHLIKVDNGTTATYTYDADGNRVQKVSATGGGGDPAGTWQFLYDQSGRMIQRFDGTFWQGNIFVGGRHLVEDGGGTNFSHSDWLGTERVRTTNTGAVCESIASLPFGDGQTTTGACYQSSPLHFTGKERDSESGLDNFGARYDSSSMGRFMNPDQLGPGQHPENPQSWNLYSYVQNNPLNLVDPTGQYTCDKGVTQSQCDNVQSALDRAQGAADAIGEKYGWDSEKYLTAQRAIDAYGDEGVDNGVHVSIDKNQTDVGMTHIGNDVGKTDSNRSGQNISVSFKNGVLDNNTKLLALEVAHEGSHVADASDWQHTGFSPNAQPRLYGTEFKAYQVMASLAEGFGSSFLLYPDRSGGIPFILYANIQSWSQAHTDFAVQGVVKSWYNLTPNSTVRAFQHNTSPQK